MNSNHFETAKLILKLNWHMPIMIAALSYAKITNGEAPLPAVLRSTLVMATSGMVGTVIVQLIRRAKERAARSITPPPGARLDALMAASCDRTTYSEVVEPIIADMQSEVFDALHAGYRLRAKVAVVRGHWRVFKSVGAFRLLAWIVPIVVRVLRGDQ